MRILSDTPNVLTLRDGISGTSIPFTYRTPTAAEHMGFAARRFKISANKVVISDTQLAEARVEYGLKILLSIREGDFGVPALDAEGNPVIENGAPKVVPLASDPQSPNYRSNWKDLLKKHASDLISLFAIEIFDGTRSHGKSFDDVKVEYEKEEVAEELVPFEKSSEDSGTAAPSS